MLFGVNKQPVLALHERQSRLLIAARPPSKHAVPMVDIIGKIFALLPAPLRRTLTVDNGTEFARHHKLHSLGTSVTRTLLGRRAASRTPSVDCAALCRARPTSRR